MCSWGYAPPHSNPKSGLQEYIVGVDHLLHNWLYFPFFLLNLHKIKVVLSTTLRLNKRNSDCNKALRARVAPSYNASHLVVSFANVPCDALVPLRFIKGGLLRSRF